MASLAPAEVELRRHVLDLVSDFKILCATDGNGPWHARQMGLGYVRHGGHGDTPGESAFQRALGEATAALSGVEGGPYRATGEIYHYSNRAGYSMVVRATAVNWPIVHHYIRDD